MGKLKVLLCQYVLQVTDTLHFIVPYTYMYYSTHNQFVTQGCQQRTCVSITEDTTFLVQKCCSFCSVLLQLATAVICTVESISSKTFPACAGETPHCVSTLHIPMMIVVQIITLTCQHLYDNTFGYSSFCTNSW